MKIIKDFIMHERNDLVAIQLKQVASGEFPAEFNEINLLLEHITEGDIIDVGANIGVHSINYAINNPNSRVFSFEPDPENILILKENVKKHNVNNIDIIECGVGELNSKGNVYTNHKNSGDCRLYKNTDFNPSNISEIDIITLDYFAQQNDLKKINYIKMDTQGYEPYIFQGAYNLIENNFPKIFFEFWPWGYKQSNANVELMLKIIKDFEYKIFNIPHYEAKKIQVDINYLLNFYNKNIDIDFHENFLLIK